MDLNPRIERAREMELGKAQREDCPPKLCEALEYAVFPGGARVRPKLTLAIAAACEAPDLELATAAAAAVEMIHCASLVHDDMPCFDNAATRRGKPSVHVAYGERIALLVGDALIVLAFQTLARGAASRPDLVARLISVLGRGVSVPSGIVSGQAWECEPEAPLARYQQQKTGALFVAATQLGAVAAGVDCTEWTRLGERMGEAYQVADDILDTTADPERIGKPVGQDTALSRPNSVLERGMRASEARLKGLVAQAIDAIPSCKGEHALRELMQVEARHFMDLALMRSAAA